MPGPYEKRFDTILDRRGRVVVNAQVRILEFPGGGVATIYSDQSGVDPIANPLVVDDDGFFEYYAADGRYSWEITTNVGTRTINDILHGAGNAAEIEALDERVTVLEDAPPPEVPTPVLVYCFEDVGSDNVPISAGTDKGVWPGFPACEILEIWAEIDDPSTAGDIVIDVHVNGTTIMAVDKLDIAEGETATSAGGATPPALTTTTIPHRARVSIDYDSAGAEATGARVYAAVVLDTSEYPEP